MSGLTFRKYAGDPAVEDSFEGLVCARQRRRQKLKLLVLAGVVLAVVAIASGSTVIGLSIYLATVLPIMLPAS